MENVDSFPPQNVIRLNKKQTPQQATVNGL